MHRSVVARRVAAAAVGLLVLTAVAFGGHTAAAQTGPPSIAVAPATAAPGDTVTFSGNVPVGADCGPTDARLTSTAALFPPDGFGPAVTRDADGDFDATFTIPSATAPGGYQVGLRCGGGNVGVSAGLQVTQPGATTSTAPNATSTAPATTATAPTTTPTTASTTTVPATTAPSSAETRDDGSSAPWIVLAVVVLAVVAAGMTILVRRRDSEA